MSKPNLTKKALLGAVALSVKSTAWAQTGCKNSGEGVAEGCKDQPGVNYLSLEETPGRNTRLCADNGNTKVGANIMPNELTVAVNPLEDAYIEMMFSVSDVVASNQAHILYLVYSPMLSPSPQIPTPRSKIKLQLDMAALEFVGIYNVPALPLLPNMPTRIGSANPSPTSRVSFKVNLDTATLPAMMRDGENTIYLQAALLRKTDFDQANYSNMILSEADTITFVGECPPTYSYCEMDDDGTLTTVIQDDAGGNMTKISETQNAEMASTTKTKN